MTIPNLIFWPALAACAAITTVSITQIVESTRHGQVITYRTETAKPDLMLGAREHTDLDLEFARFTGNVTALNIMHETAGSDINNWSPNDVRDCVRLVHKMDTPYPVLRARVIERFGKEKMRDAMGLMYRCVEEDQRRNNMVTAKPERIAN